MKPLVTMLTLRYLDVLRPPHRRPEKITRLMGNLLSCLVEFNSPDALLVPMDRCIDIDLGPTCFFLSDSASRDLLFLSHGFWLSYISWTWITGFASPSDVFPATS